MDNNEKIQLDDISFDDVIGGDGVDTVAVEEEIAPPQEDEKQIETSDEEDVLDDVEETEKNRTEMSNANLQLFSLMAPPHAHLTSPFLPSFHTSNS